MPNAPLCIKVPGKLMVAGEFAVLEPHHTLVAIAVDRFIYATIHESEVNSLTLESFNLNNIRWDSLNNHVHVQCDDGRTRFVAEAMTTSLQYLRENNYKDGKFSLSIRSELDDRSGLKYGLGSSAAVVTSVVAAILTKFLPEQPSAELIFKLAAISHVKVQGSGSGADVAASAYGGAIEYCSFQAEWLKKELEQMNSLTELLDKKWTYLQIKQIELPRNLHLCIGWTGKPASTSHLVKNVQRLKTGNATLYKKFLTDSEEAVENFLKGIDEKNDELFLKGIKQNRLALSTLGKNANTEIETPLLKKLCDLAVQQDGAGKTSGAGGGDCGIAFVPSEAKANQLIMNWKDEGIQPLDMKVYPLGAHKI